MIVSINAKPAFESVYSDNYEKLYRYCYMLLLNREDAEDILSETFLAAYRNYSDYDPGKANVITWLSKIAHNKAINLLKSSGYKNRNPLQEVIEKGKPDPLIEEMTEINETADRILSCLSLEEREFLNLRYGLELSDKEIGALLSEKENTVNKRYQRLIKKCRDIVSQ
ncbi:MAG: sigma-70 family RNA polymerase sigma factor [Lachnospiraceae bacterium]|nr:sigma-70 family RNA polymerase sigma factor [Lachnospiraceae bacterium]